MESNIFQHERIESGNEHTLRETHRLLTNIHGVVLGMIESCGEYRFEVVGAEDWFKRVTGGGSLSDLENSLHLIRDWAQEAHVNVRMAMDRAEDKEEDDGE